MRRSRHQARSRWHRLSVAFAEREYYLVRENVAFTRIATDDGGTAHAVPCTHLRAIDPARLTRSSCRLQAAARGEGGRRVHGRAGGSVDGALMAARLPRCRAWSLLLLVAAATLSRTRSASGVAPTVTATRGLWPGQPWGFYTNYPDPDHPNITDDMLTDAMSTAAGRARVEAQLKGMRAHNGTLWRIFPQFQDVLAGPSTVNKTGIATLTAALDMAHAHGMKATVTGLSDFVPAHNPAWLNEIGEDIDSEAKIQAVSELWWSTLAKAWKGHPAVFSFDLQNEPIWMSGPTSGGMDQPGTSFHCFQTHSSLVALSLPC